MREAYQFMIGQRILNYNLCVHLNPNFRESSLHTCMTVLLNKQKGTMHGRDHKQFSTFQPWMQASFALNIDKCQKRKKITSPYFFREKIYLPLNKIKFVWFMWKFLKLKLIPRYLKTHKNLSYISPWISTRIFGCITLFILKYFYAYSQIFILLKNVFT